MSLFSTATDTNKLVQRGPSSRSDSVMAVIYASGLAVPVWVTDTYHEESYSYVGMTKTAAYATAAAMNGSSQVSGQPAPLRLTVSAPTVTVEDGQPVIDTTTKIIQTGVAVPVHTGGGMWSVEVSISYTTQTMSLA